LDESGDEVTNVIKFVYDDYAVDESNKMPCYRREDSAMPL